MVFPPWGAWSPRELRSESSEAILNFVAEALAGACSRRIFLANPSSKRVMSGVRQFVYRPAGALRRYVREILWVRSEQPRLQMLLPRLGQKSHRDGDHPGPPKFRRDAGDLRPGRQQVVSRNGSSGPKPATIVFFDSPSSEQAVDIARIHPGLNYGVTLEVREWTSPREVAAAETR